MVSHTQTSQNVGTASVERKAAATRPSIKLGKSSLDLFTLMAQLDNYTVALTKKIEAFWGIPVHCKLFSLSKKPVYFTQLHDAYVSQAALSVRDPQLKGDMTLKLSSHLCSSLLTIVMGSRSNPSPVFTLSNSTTDYEKAVLAEFNKDLLSHGIKAMTRQKNPDILDHETLVLTWAVLPNVSEFSHSDKLTFKEKVETGFITIMLPANALKIPEKSQQDLPKADENFFNEAHVNAKLWLGSTKIHLSDLKMLEVSDTIVLDDSDTSKMHLITGENPDGTQAKTLFRATLKTAKDTLLNMTEEMKTMSQDTSTQTPSGQKQNLWDNLMIDVSAEFEPVKVPLKQLKDMSQGLVVEVGDIVRNTVALNVEGKILAKGTLVIVDNKFGLRIEEMVAGSSIGGETLTPAAATPTVETTQKTTATPSQESPQAEAPATEENTEDDFDLDLDDLTSDLDEDEWT